MPLWNLYPWIISPAFAQDIILSLQLVIDKYIAVLDFDSITRHSNNPLDKVPARILGILENQNLALFRLPQTINQSIDHQSLLILQSRHHGWTIHQIRLYQKITNNHGQNNGYDNGYNPILDFFT